MSAQSAVSNLSTVTGVLIYLAYGALAVLAIYLLYRLYVYAKGIGFTLWGGIGDAYEAFTAPGGVIEDQIVDLFTPKQSDGTVAPKDVKPKSVDAIDWIFMNHEDPT